MIEKSNQDKINKAFAGTAIVNDNNGSGGLKLSFRPGKDGKVEVVSQNGQPLNEQQLQAQKALQSIFDNMKVSKQSQPTKESIAEHIKQDVKEAKTLIESDIKPVQSNLHLDQSDGTETTPHDINLTDKQKEKLEMIKRGEIKAENKPTIVEHKTENNGDENK